LVKFVKIRDLWIIKLSFLILLLSGDLILEEIVKFVSFIIGKDNNLDFGYRGDKIW